MKISQFIPGFVCIVAALAVMFYLMKYAPFYAPSYFFWIGVIILLLGLISLIKPLVFLFVLNRTIAVYVLFAGLLIITVSLLYPDKISRSTGELMLDKIMPEYSSVEYHEIVADASVEEVKQALEVTGVKEVPVVLMLLKLRGIADENKDMSDKVTNNAPDPGTFVTPDFNFIIADSTELITVMVIKTYGKTPPPVVSTFEDFIAFDKPGFVKVAVNFHFKSLGEGKTLVSTETRNLPVTKRDSRIFNAYWRVIYPGSAIIRRLWLEELCKKTETLRN
jgi:hypothetical protein